jgi:hypothetical protein
VPPSEEYLEETEQQQQKKNHADHPAPERLELTERLESFERATGERVGPQARDEILVAWRTNRAGVADCLKRAAKRKAESHTGLLLHMLRTGDHEDDRPPPATRPPKAETETAPVVMASDDENRDGLAAVQAVTAKAITKEMP